MINTVKKGYNKEKLCRDQLKADGWFIAFKSVRWRFGTIDFGRLFDVVAFKGQERRFISCKHFGSGNYCLPHQEEIRGFKRHFGKDLESYELWLWDKPRWRGRGKNKVWNPGGWMKILL